MQLKKHLTTFERTFGLIFSGAFNFREPPDGFEFEVHRAHPEWKLPLSPDKISLRVPSEGRLSEETIITIGRDMALDYYEKHPEANYPFQIAGIPNAGNLLAQGFFDAWPVKGQITLLKLFKVGEGKGVISEKIEGNYDPEKPTKLIDDCITKGGSKMSTFAVLPAEEVIVYVNRKQGGKELLESQGKKCHAVLDYHKALNICLEEDWIKKIVFVRTVSFPHILDAAIAAAQCQLRAPE
jgi:orotate phosphoribosyltransferase